MEDKDFLSFLEEMETAFDEAIIGSPIEQFKNGNTEEILASDSKTKEKYIEIKEAQGRLEEKLSQYKGKLSELDKISESIVRWEKATGGEVIYRGFYNPSLTADIVIGNNKRGKLLKRPTSKSKITYEYGFDSSDRMVKVITHTEFDDLLEFFIYEGDTVFAVGYDKGEIFSACEEKHKEGKLESFTLAYSYGDEGVSTVQHECFDYNDNGHLKESEMLEISVMTFKKNKPETVRHWGYEYLSDSEGYLKKYRMTFDYPNEYASDDNDWYDVACTRKI
ncbi:MAG: hypothetical protein E7647_01695 [Ruminococcaceae bacterium]|nr:hypothetical protein [Oscillospiraceae bacterium]